jgi:hypothetical protein
MLLQSAAAWPAISHLLAAEDGYEPLFNGRDLTGWEGDAKLWVVERRSLIGRSPGISYNNFLAHQRRFEDFILKFQVRLLEDAGNSGVQFRSERVLNSTEFYGYQADVGPGWWGNLYDESRRRRTLVEVPQADRDRTVKKGQWNDYAVVALGKRIRLVLNGTVTADYIEPSATIARDGLIAVQIHSGPAMEVRFRDIRIRAL